VRLLQRFSLLRRLAVAQERTASALERIATIAEDTWAKKHAPRRPLTAEEQFGTLDLDWLNKRYDDEQAAKAAGMELEPEE